MVPNLNKPAIAVLLYMDEFGPWCTEWKQGGAGASGVGLHTGVVRGSRLAAYHLAFSSLPAYLVPPPCHLPGNMP